MTHCKKCGGEMGPGEAMQNTLRGVPDFADGQAVTMSYGGPGKLVDCLKCKECGWSVYA